jgi:hypothetical protein
VVGGYPEQLLERNSRPGGPCTCLFRWRVVVDLDADNNTRAPAEVQSILCRCRCLFLRTAAAATTLFRTGDRKHTIRYNHSLCRLEKSPLGKVQLANLRCTALISHPPCRQATRAAGEADEKPPGEGKAHQSAHSTPSPYQALRR